MSLNIKILDYYEVSQIFNNSNEECAVKSKILPWLYINSEDSVMKDTPTNMYANYEKNPTTTCEHQTNDNEKYIMEILIR